MPNFKQSILYLGVLLGILLLLHFLYFPISFYFFIALILAFFGIIVFGAARIDSNFFIETICKGDTTEKVIALTFDDGPDATHTPPLLDFLKKHELLATFFCIGKKIDEQEDLVKRIDREGHLLGNHSYSHSKVFDFFLSKKVQGELRLTQTKIQNCIEKKVRFFRPPYGVTNPHIAEATQKENYKVIGWNIRTMDTVEQNPDKIFEKIKRFMQPGSIILFHDTKPVALNVLKKLVPYLEAQNYRIIRLDDLVGEAAYHY